MAQDDPALAPIIAYLEQHQAQVNIEALRKQLLAAGHPPALVDAAVRRVQGDAPPRPPPAWPIGLLVMLLDLFVLWVVFIGVTAAMSNNFSSPWLALGAVAIPIAAQLAAGLALRGGPRDRLGRALLWGLAFTACLFALLALLFGICVAIIAGLYGANL